MPIPNQEIPVGDIAFFDNYLPSIADGIYTIKTVTSIDGAIDTEEYFDTPIKQDFEVRGPQFSLPATEVHSIYPPNNSNSTYDQFLPNIVLNKRVFPWERVFGKKNSGDPWVCLLVFAEGEIAIDPKTHSALKTSTGSDFLGKSGDVLKPDIPLASVPTDVLASNCSSIQVSAEVFKAVAPKVEELKFLSHVRQVNTGDQAIMGFEDDGWYSVLTGNRLLKTTAAHGTRFFVHLVSLEGYFKIMNGEEAWPKKESNPAEDKDIALASLYNWSFLSQPEKLDFKELVENLAAQAEGDPDNLLLRRNVVPPSSPDPATKETLERLEGGYVPLSYETSTGENTFAWYRGPLTPVIAQPLPRASEDYHYPSASSMMIFDKDTGVFNQSYAAAWSMGRALALADGAFSQLLMKYRKKSHGIVGELIDALASVSDASETDLAEVLQSSVVRDAFKALLTNEVGSKVTELVQDDVKSPQLAASSMLANPESENPVDVAKSFLAESAVQDFLKQETKDDLIPIASWLAHKQLLYDVPFNHLVPDQLSLPVESMRFFYVDQNWLDSLVDGAISIGVQSSKDSFFNGAMRGVLDDAVVAETKSIREALLGASTGDKEADSDKEALSGVLIRSAIVAGWPGLAVKGFKGDYQTGTQLKMLRMDRLSPNVLLCIFLDIPDTVMLAEPQQGLCFGVEDGDVINLRQLANPPGKPTGKSFPSAGGFETFFRPVTGAVGADVLNINDGPKSVVQSMGQSQYLNTAMGPADFALEMVKAPEEISFTNIKGT